MAELLLYAGKWATCTVPGCTEQAWQSTLGDELLVAGNRALASRGERLVTRTVLCERHYTAWQEHLSRECETARREEEEDMDEWLAMALKSGESGANARFQSRRKDDYWRRRADARLMAARQEKKAAKGGGFK